MSALAMLRQLQNSHFGNFQVGIERKRTNIFFHNFLLICQPKCKLETSKQHGGFQNGKMEKRTSRLCDCTGSL